MSVWAATVSARVVQAGEEIDDRRRGQMPGDSLDILTAASSGEPVRPPAALHRGRHPVPPQAGAAARRAVWVAGSPGNVKPLHRAARYQGFFPVNLDHPDQLAEAVAAVAGLRPAPMAPYNITMSLPAGHRPGALRRGASTPGGCRSSIRPLCRWTRCGACSATDLRPCRPWGPTTR